MDFKEFVKKQGRTDITAQRYVNLLKYTSNMLGVPITEMTNEDIDKLPHSKSHRQNIRTALRTHRDWLK